MGASTICTTITSCSINQVLVIRQKLILNALVASFHKKSVHKLQGKIEKNSETKAFWLNCTNSLPLTWYYFLQKLPVTQPKNDLTYEFYLCMQTTLFENDSITDINYPALFSLFLIHT